MRIPHTERRTAASLCLPHPIPQAGVAQCREGTPQLERVPLSGKGKQSKGPRSSVLWSTARRDTQRPGGTGRAGSGERPQSWGGRGSEACLLEKDSAAAPGGAPQAPPAPAHRQARSPTPAPKPRPALPTQPLWSPGATPAAASGLWGGQPGIARYCQPGARQQPPLPPHTTLCSLGRQASSQAPQRRVGQDEATSAVTAGTTVPAGTGPPAVICVTPDRLPPALHCIPTMGLSRHGKTQPAGRLPPPEQPQWPQLCCPTWSPTATCVSATSRATALGPAAGPHSQMHAHPHAGHRAIRSDAELLNPGGPLRTQTALEPSANSCSTRQQPHQRDRMQGPEQKDITLPPKLMQPHVAHCSLTHQTRCRSALGMPHTRGEAAATEPGRGHCFFKCRYLY